MTPSEVQYVVDEVARTGSLPRNIPRATLDEVSKSFARYFTDAGAAKVEQFADKAKQLLEDSLKADTSSGAAAGETWATARASLLEFLEGHGQGGIGEAMDLDFFLKIPMEVASGAASKLAQNWDQERVDEFPGLELRRVYQRDVPRGSERDPQGPENGWDEDDGRWPAACAEAGDDDAAKVFEGTGRMVALKSSGAWQALGDGAGGYEDTLGNDYEPFAFNSGMATDEVSYDECVALGLLDDGDEVEKPELDLAGLLGFDARRAVKAGNSLSNAVNRARELAPGLIEGGRE